MQRLLIYIPAASVVIITVGYLNTYIFYRYFEISIQNYLSPAEIIFSISSFTIPIFLSLCLALYWLILYKEKQANKPFKESNRLSRYFSKSSYKLTRALSSAFKWPTIIMAFGSALVIFFAVDQVFNHPDEELMENSVNYDFDFLLLILLCSALAILLHQFVQKNLLNARRTWSIFLLTVIIGIFCFLIHRNGKSANFILDGQPKYSISLKTREKMIYSSSDSIFFVGSTQGFYFLHDRPNRQNIIIPASEVIEVKIRQLRYGL